MPDRANVAYCYDGSFEGLLCCIFESFEKKERPVSIQPEGMGAINTLPAACGADRAFEGASRGSGASPESLR